MSKNGNIDLWTEIYRPKTLDNVYGQELIIDSCKTYIEKGMIPHLIFSGPAGVGKTSTALILAEEIAGEGNTLIINASDENNINKYRTDIKDWIKVVGENISTIKILILDEGDNLSPQTQQILRRMLEEYSKYFRLILTCNYANKIIDPIESRCVHLKFIKMPEKLILKRIYTISKEQKLEISVNNLKLIVKTFNGDMRKCINIINSIKMGANLKALVSYQNPYTFLKIITNGNENLLKKYIDKYLSSDRDIRPIIKRCIEILISEKKVCNKLDISDLKNRSLILLLAEGDYRMAMGAQYDSVLYWIYYKLNDEV